MIPLDQIDLPPVSLRPAPDPAAFAALVESIRTLGVLQPVLLTRATNSNRFVLVKGEQRLKAARAAGLTEIPAHVEAGLVGQHAEVARVAATLVRQPLGLMETWRALGRMQDSGLDADRAAVSLGLDPRAARRMERLSRLHPDVLAALEAEEARPADERELPNLTELGDIARADPDTQALLLRKADRYDYDDEGKADWIDWADFARLCHDSGKRIPRARAIFDPALISWDEDLFAEPGAPDQFTTAEVARFMALQRAAFDQLLAKRRDITRERLLPSAIDGYGNGVPSKLAKGDGRVYVLELDERHGHVRWTLVRHLAATPAPASPAADDARDEEGDGDDGTTDPSATPDDATDEDEAGEAEEPPTTHPAAAPLTKHGQQLLARARTEALRHALRAPESAFSHDDLLAMLLLALAAGTVKVRSSHHNYASLVDMADLAPRLVNADGTLRPDADVGRLAQEALARMLSIPGPDDIRHLADNYTDPVPEWIGAWVGATDHLPRLDTEAFLATVAGAELKAWAKAEGLKLAKVGDIRARMTGRAEHWRPTWSHFGARGPA